MARTLAQQLDAVDRAIELAEMAQSSASGDGRSISFGNLADLYAERRRLERKIVRASDDGKRVCEL